MANDRSASAQIKKNTRAEEWLKNAVKDKHVRLIPFSEISKVKYNVAKGGSGTIHLGAWRNMHVAIKEQHNTNDLIKELKMHKQVHDSNYIVKFFGITKHPLTHDTCIVMQFAENGCLQDYLETQNVSITWLTKYRLAWEVASGLDFIHRENIFHTDLHSRNILIDTGGKALITDFGLSKSVNKTIYTTKAGLFGVVPYVAPERMQNPSITYNAKCDIYSLGVIFWELSSCVIPFEAQLQDVMLAVNIIAGVREKTVPGTAVEYEMLYRRCWDGLPQNRPQMDIVLSELVELLASEQINPRPAALRPTSPRPPRPLSSDSMMAPGMTVPYENDATLQSSPENTNHMRPVSPPMLVRPGARQSFAQGMAPLVQQAVPSVPIRQDRSGVRVSFLGDFPRENHVSGHNKVNGTTPADVVRNNIKPSPQTANKSVNNTNNDNRNAANTDGQTNNPRDDLDSPTLLDVIPNASHSSKSPTDDMEQEQSQAQVNQGGTAEPAHNSGPSSTSHHESAEAPAQFLPPLPAFNELSISPHSSPSNGNTAPSAPPQQPAEPFMGRLPETAALALSNGISMVEVVNKLKLGTVRNIPTISPPPNGAPPPPPGAVAGHSNSPRVVSPPSNRPRVVSPKTRNNQAPVSSKTISPPTGAPPLRAGPSPSLGPIPRPPPGPPPTPMLSPSSAPSGRGTDPRYASPESSTSPNPTASMPYNRPKPEAGTDMDQNSIGGGAAPPSGNMTAFSDTTRPTPARQIPIGFPVVTPLSPPHWNRVPAPPKSDHPSATSPPSTLKHASDTSPSGSPSSANSTAPSSTGTSASANRRDFRPISFLTQQNHSGLIDLSARVDQQLQEQQHHMQTQMRKPTDNGFMPNPNNNIIPPSLLHMQRAHSPDLERIDRRNSRMLGSPSLRPAPSPTPESANNRTINSPHLAPSNGRPSSPALSVGSASSSRTANGGGFPVVETPSRIREQKNPARRPSEDDDQQADVRSISEPRDLRPQLHPTKESSSSTNMGTSFSTSPSTQTSAVSSSTANTGATPPLSSSSSSASTPASKPRVPFDNFYSLADPYKELNHDDPADFFIAVTQSDSATIERMLKSHPNLIHDSNGFWPHPTAILVAARSRDPIETMKVLIRHGAALDRGDHNGTTVLHFVCEHYSNPLEAILFLTRAGADCNSRDAKKRTPLMVLLQNAKLVSTKVLIESMRALFKHGAQAKGADYQQKSPLHYAILHCKDPAPAMEMLLRKGADVNAKDWRKCTPLHTVLERMDNEENVQMLLLYGADPGLKNGNKRNALGVAAENLRVMSSWFLLENDLLSSVPDSIKKASELCSKADGPDKSAKPLFKNMLSDWQGKEGRLRRIQLAQDCVLRVQRTPDMKTIDQTQVALEFLESVGQPIHMNTLGGSNSNISPTSSSHSHR
ncbi:hypothetical protein BGX28_009068 [Mortierella sp. GBA30]|nr:hypothetical protein BGX28_009068 [Mortierella sp. GBA30]